jgi:hypothetical protein
LSPQPKRLIIRQLADALPHKAFPCKSDKTWAAKSCPTLFAHGHRFSKYCYALQPHKPPSFCLISPEAALLTNTE